MSRQARFARRQQLSAPSKAGQLLPWQLCLKLCTPPHSCQRAQPAIEPCGSACQPMTPLLPTAAFGFGLGCTSCRQVCRQTRHWRAESFIRTGHCNAIPEAIRGGVRIPLPEDPFLGSAGICSLLQASSCCSISCCRTSCPGISFFTKQKLLMPAIFLRIVLQLALSRLGKAVAQTFLADPICAGGCKRKQKRVIDCLSVYAVVFIPCAYLMPRMYRTMCDTVSLE